MNESTNERIPESPRRWAVWLMILGIIGFALIMFRQVLVPGLCLFTTDDNIGGMQLQKSGLSFLANNNYGDTVLMGMPGGVASFNWNGFILRLLPIRVYINWIHALELAVASLFFMLFLRRRHVAWPAIALGLVAAFWVGSNLTLTYAGHIGKFGVVMWAGAALFCIFRALSGRTSVEWSILAGGAIGFMFLEQLDVALFFGFVLGAYALFLVVRQWQTHGTWVKSGVALVLMGGIGLILAASTMFGSYAANVQNVTQMQTESPREKWDYVTQWSWPPDECIDFIAPGYTGWRSGEAAGPYWGRMGRSAGWEQNRQGFMNFKLENMYLGIIPVLLALFAIMMASIDGKTVYPQMTQMDTDYSDRRAEIIFWGCVAAVTLLLAFGKFFPLYALFYKLPFVNSIRNPNKFLQVFQLVLGVLAAYGLDEMLRLGRAADNGRHGR